MDLILSTDDTAGRGEGRRGRRAVDGGGGPTPALPTRHHPLHVGADRPAGRRHHRHGRPLAEQVGRSSNGEFFFPLARRNVT